MSLRLGPNCHFERSEKSLCRLFSDLLEYINAVKQVAFITIKINPLIHIPDSSVAIAMKSLKIISFRYKVVVSVIVIANRDDQI